jgi:outer membrane murein-binding lipoprotein Lpp
MKIYCLTLSLSAIFLFGCFTSPGTIRELSQRQDALEAKMDELLEELKANNSNINRDVDRIDNNQMLLAEEIEIMQKKNLTLGKKIEKATNKNEGGGIKAIRKPLQQIRSIPKLRPAIMRASMKTLYWNFNS